MSTRSSLAVVVSASLLVGGCAATVERPSQKQMATATNRSTCYAMNTDFDFRAEAYERPWLANSSAPFSFANLFDFMLPEKLEARISYARLEADPEGPEVRVLFLSSSNEIVFQKLLHDSHVDCGDNRTVVSERYSVHGADSFGGSKRTVTVTLTRLNGSARAISQLEATSRWLIFTSSAERTETWAQFRQRNVR